MHKLEYLNFVKRLHKLIINSFIILDSMTGTENHNYLLFENLTKLYCAADGSL